MGGDMINDRTAAIFVAVGTFYILRSTLGFPRFRRKVQVPAPTSVSQGRAASSGENDDGVEAGAPLSGWRRAAYELAVFLLATSLSFLMILLYRKLVRIGWLL